MTRCYGLYVIPIAADEIADGWQFLNDEMLGQDSAERLVAHAQSGCGIAVPALPNKQKAYACIVAVMCCHTPVVVLPAALLGYGYRCSRAKIIHPGNFC